uniref:Stage II sporulation protein E n=1 Tax=Schlesneria paludicola TaxID=360056 RepID=A0A7C4LNT9_9PLAN
MAAWADRGGAFAEQAAWQQRLATVVETMKELSRQTDPQEMVRNYVRRMQQLVPVDRRISLSRRGLTWPRFRVTRFSGWDDVNPWQEGERLPILSGGLLAELIYGDLPRIIPDLNVARDDPAYEFLEGQRSLQALPLYDQGVALNMVVTTRREPDAFSVDDLPERLWMANLFGRATQNLVLAEQLQAAYNALERELQVVADIQRSLLPAELPRIATMQLAAHYQTSRHVGGDYYDFFPLAGGRWGILIADVSGHGTPAAVVMAITQCITHLLGGEQERPSQLLSQLNAHLTAGYTSSSGHFVTAFYAIFEPETRRLTYSSAGHNPPRLRHCGESHVAALDAAGSLPLGLLPQVQYRDADIGLRPGDRLVFYTDGITEAANAQGELFGTARLDFVVGDCRDDVHGALRKLLEAISAFTGGHTASDDRTLIVADVV